MPKTLTWDGCVIGLSDYGQVKLAVIDQDTINKLYEFMREYQVNGRSIRFPWEIYDADQVKRAGDGVLGIIWLKMARSGPTRKRQEALARELNTRNITATVTVSEVQVRGANRTAVNFTLERMTLRSVMETTPEPQ